MEVTRRLKRKLETTATVRDIQRAMEEVSEELQESSVGGQYLPLSVYERMGYMLWAFELEAFCNQSNLALTLSI